MSEKRPRSSGKLRTIVAIFLIVPLALLCSYIYLALHWSYSEGDRSGILQKFSRKGWICKTYEGELAMTTVPGVAPTIWSFSVRDKAVAQEIRKALGRKVVLHYAEHRGIPTSCFGETSYFVDAVEIRE